MKNVGKNLRKRLQNGQNDVVGKNPWLALSLNLPEAIRTPYLPVLDSYFFNKNKTNDKTAINQSRVSWRLECSEYRTSKSLEVTECPTVDIEIYNKRKKEIVAKQ